MGIGRKLAVPAANFAKGCLAAKAVYLNKTKGVPPIEKGKFDKIDAPVSDHFTMGFASRIVTPDDVATHAYYIAGYKSNNPAVGVLDDLTCSAVWIDDNSGRGAVVFVSADNVGMTNNDVNAVKAEMADFLRETGCRSVNIMATHDHAGIDTMGIWGPIPKKIQSGKDPKYMRILFDGIQACVREAYETRRDGQIYLGRKDAPEELQNDKRLPWVFSRAVTRLRFVPDDGGREIYFINFAAHSESLLGRNSLISADFPGEARRLVKAAADVDIIYFVGAIGGMITTHEVCEDNIESMRQCGRMLADTILAIDKDTEEKLEPVMNILRQEFYLSGDNPVLMLGGKLKLLDAQSYPTAKGVLKQSLKTEMTYISMGALQMALCPGEVFPELIYGGYLSAEESASGKGAEANPRPFIEIADDPNLLVFGLANDEIGYIIPPNDFLVNAELPYIEQTRDRLDRRHYEEVNSLGPDTAPGMAAVFEEMMRTVKAAK